MRITLFFIYFFLSGAAVFSQSFTIPDSLLSLDRTETIKVGIKPSEPFIIEASDGDVEGLSIYLWEDVAEELAIDSAYVKFADLSQLLNAVEKSEVDLSVNPLTVTPRRLVNMQFTQPFFITNLAIAVRNEQQSPIIRLFSNIFSWQFWTALGLLSLVILIFGFMAWLFERKQNTEEFTPGIKGLWESFWWSAVTMTTVGYGDKAPKTIGGRIVGLIWMFTAIIIICGFTASIASSLTVDQLSFDINNLKDLKGAKVVTVKASTSDKYLESKGISAKRLASIEEALKAVESGEADAFVYDEPLLRFKINENQLEGKISIAPATFLTQYYAYALPLKESRVQALNLAILKQLETLEWKAELSEYELD